MNFFKKAIASLVFAAFALPVSAASPSGSSVVAFNDFSLFSAAASGLGGSVSVEDFESYTPTFGSPQVLNDFTVSEVGDFSGSNNVVFNAFNSAADSSVVSGTQSIYSFENNLTSEVLFNGFSAPLNAFGAYITTSKDTFVNLSVNGFNSFVELAKDTPQFFGVIDVFGTFTDVTVGTPFDDQVLVGFDNVAFGAVSPVPEASTLAMMAGGLGLVGFMAARRRKQA